MMNVNVYGKDGKNVVGEIAKPKVFDIELRPDMVMKTFACVNQNSKTTIWLSLQWLK
ncbi:LSU ribosomal protein L1E [Enterocytozoon bieneusi H348]|nr:LSU ribosomal protein L1E [Enterocytozoon bieneusi H348]|eukprot:XP_002651284.1 LSU ribosomal protein L1E [Enterocytozoon bieneusi H348]